MGNLLSCDEDVYKRQYKDRVEGLGWKQDRISEALTVAEHSDVVVLCLGLDENLEGEEGDTGNLSLIHI